MEVLVRGDLSLYAPRGQFQIQIKNLYLSGEGELWLAFETLKKKAKPGKISKEKSSDHLNSCLTISSS